MDTLGTAFFCSCLYFALVGHPDLAAHCDPQLDKLKFMRGRFRMDFSTDENWSVSCWSLSRVLQVAVLQKSSCSARPLAILRPRVEIPTSSQGLSSAQVFPPQPFLLPAGREFLAFSVADPFWDNKDLWHKQDGLLRDSELADCNHISWASTAVAEACWMSPPALLPPILFWLSFCYLASSLPASKGKKLAEETCTTGYLM